VNLFLNSVVITSLLIPGTSIAVGSEVSPQDIGKSSMFSTSMNLNPLKAKTATRFTEDQPDKYNGLQIRAIYVVPLGTTDRNLDTNGTIEKYLREGNKFLKNTIGETFQLDTRLDGTFRHRFLEPGRQHKELAINGFLGGKSW
jgi:hypothetical protein